MPSLRQKVTTYFRQLSFIAESRESPRSSHKEDDGNFITKYLEGRMERIFTSGPEIFTGKNPSDVPELKIDKYSIGSNTIIAACTGPDDGLTGIKRSKLHLSASFGDDIDFIDTIQDDCYEVRKSITTNNHSTNKFGRFNSSRKYSTGTSNDTNDQNANKVPGMRSRKNSRTGISNLSQTPSVDKTKTTPSQQKCEVNSNKATTIVVSMVSTKQLNTGKDDSRATNMNKETTCKTKTDLAVITDNSPKITATCLETNAKSSNTKVESISKNVTNSKLVDDTTERLLREAVSSQASSDVLSLGNKGIDSIASVSNWKMESDYAYGISVSLYENNMLTKEPMGSPIADCYGMVVRKNAAAMALADGVNWGDGARLAARSAVHGCLDYLDRAIFGLSQECMASSTQEVFVSLLRSVWEGHGCILEVGGALSTLTIAVVLPIADEDVDINDPEENKENPSKYIVCACNVGDSLGYVYSKKHGVREFTQGSHDISSMRDMRDALGAIGPADGNKPELSNLTFSMTVIEEGDIVFLTSDGVSDNFDPVVGKFAEAWTPEIRQMPSQTQSKPMGVLAPKRQNKSSSAIYARLHRNEVANVPPNRPPRAKKASTPESGDSPINAVPHSRPKYLRSHTVIEPCRVSTTNSSARQNAHFPKIPKSSAGLPLVTGPQRHALTLYRLEDLLSYGINGTFSPCSSSRRLCHLLIDFVRMITSARRKTLEQRELFYKLATGPDGVKREVEMNRIQHRVARKRAIDSSAYSALPGKLDHATVVAYTVGANPTNVLQKTKLQGGVALEPHEFRETNF